MQIYSLTTHSPAFNLACEELLTRRAAEPVFMLWRNAPSIIVGCNQNTASEIDGDYVHAHGIQVVRRITGGGAVYHDLGNINYSCISLERTWTSESAAGFVAPIIQALQHLGIAAEYSGRNDIIANGCKVSGCARSVLKEHTLFHGTLLFDTDLDVLAQALKPDPEKIRAKGIKSVRARVGNMKEMLPEDNASLDVDGFLRHLEKTVCTYYGCNEIAEPDKDFLAEVEELAASKYRTWEWNYGSNLAYEVHNRLRFNGGIIHAEFNVSQNAIVDLRLTGDFFGTAPIADLIPKLQGCRPEHTATLSICRTLPLQEYISGITPEELATVLTVE